jgi:hypothetical protein
MKNLYPLLIFLFVVSNLCQSQVLHREMLSASGTTSKSSNGYTVTQTIGQSSIIGNYSSAPFTVSQGFQQSNWARLIFQNENQLSSDIKFFPNPVIDNINFVFTISDMKNLNLLLFDPLGRKIYNEFANASGNKITYNLQRLPAGTYLALLTNKQLKFYTKIIKK